MTLKYSSACTHEAADKSKTMTYQRKGTVLKKFSPKEPSTTTFFAMDFPIIVIDQLFNESLIFFFHLISHVGNIAQNCLIFYLKSNQMWFIPWIHYASSLSCLMDSLLGLFRCVNFLKMPLVTEFPALLKTGHFVLPGKPQMGGGNATLREKKSV